MPNQLANTRCLAEACRRLKLPVRTYDGNGNLLSVKIGGREFFFANYATPFNSGSFCRIAKDKEFTRLVLGDTVPMPKTKGVLDPHYDGAGGGEETPASMLSGAVSDILKEFSFPLMIKPNSLSRGRNCSLCATAGEIAPALAGVFRKDRDYDYVALVQEYVKPKAEYRVVVFQNEAVLVYTRERAVNDKWVIREIEEFIRPVFKVLPVGFAGLDIIFAEDGRKFLLEINSEPGFAHFIEKNGEEPVIKMYCKMLSSLP